MPSHNSSLRKLNVSLPEEDLWPETLSIVKTNTNLVQIGAHDNSDAIVRYFSCFDQPYKAKRPEIIAKIEFYLFLNKFGRKELHKEGASIGDLLQVLSDLDRAGSSATLHKLEYFEHLEHLAQRCRLSRNTFRGPADEEGIITSP
jgi:hypothetical protein